MRVKHNKSVCRTSLYLDGYDGIFLSEFEIHKISLRKDPCEDVR